LFANDLLFKAAGTLENANDINSNILRAILENDYDSAYTALFDSDDGFHTKDQAVADRANFDLMKNYYTLCMDVSHMDTLGPTPIYADIATIQNSFFPVVDDGSKLFSSAEKPMISQTLAAFNMYGISTLNTLFVDADDKNPDMNAVLFDQAELALPSKEYYEDPANLEKYKTGLNAILLAVLGDGTEHADVRSEESKKQNLTLWTEEKIAAAVGRFITFETQLANISLKK
jgi:endothelin-converting enzyme